MSLRYGKGGLHFVAELVISLVLRAVPNSPTLALSASASLLLFVSNTRY